MRLTSINQNQTQTKLSVSADTAEREIKMANMNVEQMVEELSTWTVMDVATLVQALEEKWGVSAAPVAAAAAPGAAAPGAEPEAEKTEFDVELTEAGGQKIKVIKAIREITQLGLSDAKKLVEDAPKVIKEAIGKEAAEEIKKKLEEVGAKVTLK